MKALHVITGLGVGGAEMMLLKTLPLLEGEHIVCSLMDHNAVGKRIEKAGITVHYLHLQKWNLPAVIVRLRKLIKKENPDIVNSYLLHTNILVRFLTKKRVFCSVRNIHRDRKLLNSIDKLTQGLVTEYVANSPVVAEYLVSELGIKKKITVVPNCIDGVKLRNEISKADSKKLRKELHLNGLVLLYVATLKRQKGHEYLLRALAKVTVPFTLLLVGNGELREELEALAVTLGISKKVQFLGSRNDVPSLYAVADCVVFPSLHEGMSNALLEAGAAELPVICTSIPENRIVLGAHAIYVTPKEIGELAQAIETFRKEKVAAMAKKAKQYVEQHFSIIKTVAQLNKIYKRRD